MVRKVNSSMRYSEMIFELAKHLAEAEEDEIVKLKKKPTIVLIDGNKLPKMEWIPVELTPKWTLVHVKDGS